MEPEGPAEGVTLEEVPDPEEDVKEVARCINEAIRTSANEMELREKVASCLKRVAGHLGLACKSDSPLPSRLKPDMLCGRAVIEFKAPGRLSSDSGVEKAVEQVKGYIEELRKRTGLNYYVGVIISDKVVFVEYDSEEGWRLRGPYSVNERVAAKLVKALRRLGGLDAESLARNLGPGSPTAQRLVKLLYSKLANPSSPQTRKRLEEWKERRALLVAADYGLRGVDYDALLFAIHTYYAFLIRLAAATTSNGKALLEELEDNFLAHGADGLKSFLADARADPSVDLPPMYFDWIIDELDEGLARAVVELAEKLSSTDRKLLPAFSAKLYDASVARDAYYEYAGHTPETLGVDRGEAERDSIRAPRENPG